MISLFHVIFQKLIIQYSHVRGSSKGFSCNENSHPIFTNRDAARTNDLEKEVI